MRQNRPSQPIEAGDHDGYRPVYTIAGRSQSSRRRSICGTECHAQPLQCWPRWPGNHVPPWLFARNAAGKVQGGVRGQTYWSWCTIDVLAVAEPYRRQGIGSCLLAKAEEIARARGCVGIRLDTTSFQAPHFYTRRGFTEFGRIEVIRQVTHGSGS